ncbi:MAG: hypothetical protein H0V47_06765, partial [Chloroflexia bacterium]|nr:hypothetical protein [Chloroflexia bacterium]
MSDRKYDELYQEALTGRLNRRDVLRKGAALGLSIPVIASLLAACGDDDDETPGVTDTAPTSPAGGTTPDAMETPEDEETPDMAGTPESEETPDMAGTPEGQETPDMAGT